MKIKLPLPPDIETGLQFNDIEYRCFGPSIPQARSLPPFSSLFKKVYSSTVSFLSLPFLQSLDKPNPQLLGQQQLSYIFSEMKSKGHCEIPVKKIEKIQ